MESKITLIYNFVSNHYIDHTYLIIYIINLILSIIAYKLGFARRLPLLKSLFVYFLLVIGTYITTIFSVLSTTSTPPLPIPESLVIISLVLAIYRFRLHRERQIGKPEKENTL